MNTKAKILVTHYLLVKFQSHLIRRMMASVCVSGCSRNSLRITGLNWQHLKTSNPNATQTHTQTHIQAAVRDTIAWMSYR